MAIATAWKLGVLSLASWLAVELIGGQPLLRVALFTITEGVQWSPEWGDVEFRILVCHLLTVTPPSPSFEKSVW